MSLFVSYVAGVLSGAVVGITAYRYGRMTR